VVVCFGNQRAAGRAGAIGTGVASLLGVLVWFAWIVILTVSLQRLARAPIRESQPLVAA
jgi:hypothetical protein